MAIVADKAIKIPLQAIVAVAFRYPTSLEGARHFSSQNKLAIIRTQMNSLW
jgi:hypothetical protein